ncbi:MAG: L-threonine 3-dehydrogenase [Oceanospirillaceae bacterium]|nr:L-threonine 3-dehydrogenase [Oceanospirillaceae bacterium]MBT6077157.1 L-threonine 3-dehydrogenase [Oceanospirillaceae bacterium]
MRALTKQKASRGLWMGEVIVPQYGHNDVLIKVMQTAICGTDVHIYNWDQWAQKTIPIGMTIGHEFVGEIVAMGDKVTSFEIGLRVSGEGHITCGHCRNCRAGRRHLCIHTVGVGVNRNGAFAEYLSLPAENVFPVADEIDNDHAAIFDPLGNAAHTALSFDLVGEDVLITGAGPIGVMAAAIAHHAGSRNVVVTDVNPYRLALAEKMGATRAVDVSNTQLTDVMQQLNMKEGFDVGLEMSGAMPALEQMLSTMNHGGKIAMLGLPSDKTAIDWSQVIFKGLTIKGIYGREMYDTWYKMSSMLQSGLNIEPILTHRFAAADFQQGFDVMRSGNSGKVILDW